MKNVLLWSVAVAISATAGSRADAQSAGIVDRASRYLKAQEQAMQRSASMADIDRLMRFYTPDYVYRDARVGITVAGVDRVRRGSASHLGETRDATVRVQSAIANGGTVALKVRTSFTLTENGAHMQRSNLVVLHFVGDKIAERIDF